MQTRFYREEQSFDRPEEAFHWLTDALHSQATLTLYNLCRPSTLLALLIFLSVGLAIMQTRKTITIVTSPPTRPMGLPTITSPGAKQAPVYRVEERSRTIYVASDVDPSQWDTHSLNTIFTLTEANENGVKTSDEPIRRTQSYVDAQVIITEDASDRSDESRVSSPRISVYHPRRPAAKRTSVIPPTSTGPRRVSPIKATSSSSRPRILFYHKHNPYYGFTNFSPHPVIYNSKKYPTSEHLFQSFKVTVVSLFAKCY